MLAVFSIIFRYLSLSYCFKIENDQDHYPLLFLVAMDFVLQQGGACTGAGIHWPGHDHLGDFDFADDILLLAEDEKKLQTVTADLDSEANKVGLRISSKKLKVMHVNFLC